MLSQQLKKLWEGFSRPSVFIFILIGTVVIFCTFLTNDNAIEIAISGFASVFIGIGVNNYTTYQTHDRDERIIKKKVEHAVKVLDMANEKINHIYAGLDAGTWEETHRNLHELTQYIYLLRALLIDEETLT
ncbi:MAG: hypothetical protein ACTHMV_20140 [Chitinophagaceae bacterium]